MKFIILENTKRSWIINICSVRNCIFLNHFKGNFYLSLMFYMKSPFFFKTEQSHFYYPNKTVWPSHKRT